ncbi:Leupeptin-inactivating enzyme 1 precursor [Kocuria rosea]|uniref:M28 family metallopeptidase n=1 Tax=Kocuria rosea TaxID=1275 RepID=UPI000F6DE494|nr:M28 family metallopeptidase [Kocuria rosea]VEH42504.1 Leupeptin-inactivating enzyme 1 precursor [Kocuria rosea]
MTALRFDLGKTPGNDDVPRAAAPDALRALTAAAVDAGAAWTRLGDTLLVTGAPAQLERTAAGRIPAERIGVPVARLHLVIQNGRQFQQAHPEVRVLVDRGRYLVVDLDPAEAGRFVEPSERHVPCFGVRPLPACTVVFEQRPPSPAPTLAVAEPRIAALSRDAFEADLRTLAGFRTRHSTSTEFRTALDWAEGVLSGLGFATRTQTVALHGGSTQNLVAERPGRGGDGRAVLVTAHLDSINSRDGTAAPAPGADDNGSGAAGVLAVARALRDHLGARDLRLILFGGEEQGLFGSRHYVAELEQQARERIHAVVNMDMIACRNTPAPTVLLEGAAASRTVLEELAAAAQAHTGLTVQTSLMPFNSDHVPFLDAGIPAVLTIEGADGANDRIHTAGDTLEHIDHDLALEILRMNVAYLVQALGQA